MANPTKKKRQHFVPRFLLRNFSPNGRTVSTYVFRSDRLVHAASLKDQCYRNYFYGQDNKIENSISELENHIATIVRFLIASEFESIRDVELFFLKYFVVQQYFRTFGAAELKNEMHDKYWKTILAHDKRVSEIELDKYRIVSTNPQLENLGLSVKAFPSTADLGVKFLISRPPWRFVISDDPVILHNQFAESRPALDRIGGSVGFAVKGLQIFLPVHPYVNLALYDAGTYEYGSAKRNWCFVGKRDVRILNELQAYVAKECVYVTGEMIHVADRQRLLSRWKEGQNSRAPIVEEFASRPQPGKRQSFILRMGYPENKLGLKFSFVRETENRTFAGYNAGALPIRSAELMDFSEAWRRRVFQEDLSKLDNMDDLHERFVSLQRQHAKTVE